MKSGDYKLIGFDISTHFDEDLIIIEKFDPRKILSVVYYDGKQGYIYLKRFQVEESDKKTSFTGDNPDSKMMQLSLDYRPMLEVIFDEKKNEKEIENLEVDVEEFISVKGYKAKGKRLSNFFVKKLNWLDPLPYDLPEPETEDMDENTDGTDETHVADQDDATETPKISAKKVTEVTKGKEKEVNDELVQAEPPAKKKDPQPASGKKAQEPTKPEATEKKKKPDDGEKKQMSLFD
jgi:hypothetical protein